MLATQVQLNAAKTASAGDTTYCELWCTAIITHPDTPDDSFINAFSNPLLGGKIIFPDEEPCEESCSSRNLKVPIEINSKASAFELNEDGSIPKDEQDDIMHLLVDGMNPGEICSSVCNDANRNDTAAAAKCISGCSDFWKAVPATLTDTPASPSPAEGTATPAPPASGSCQVTYGLVSVCVALVLALII